MFGRLFGKSSPNGNKGQLENQSAKTARAASGKGSAKGSRTPASRSQKWGQQQQQQQTATPRASQPSSAATPTAAAGGMFSGMSFKDPTPAASPAPSSGLFRWGGWKTQCICNMCRAQEIELESKARARGPATPSHLFWLRLSCIIYAYSLTLFVPFSVNPFFCLPVA